MITELTPEQEAQLKVYAEKWRNIGLSTEPANRPQAEKGIWLAYKLVGLSPPQHIIWHTSPLNMNSLDIPVSVKDVVFSFPKESVRHTIRQRVDSSIAFLEIDSVHRVDDLIADLTLKAGSSSLEKPVLSSLYDCVNNWLAFYMYFDYIGDVFGLTLETARLEGLFQIVKNAGWWLPCQDICHISERHNILKLDDQDRPHCEDGLAIGYPDGWGVYAWHGVRVPEWVILRPEQITPDNIMSEDNTEVARVMLERYGQDNFIRDGGFSIVQSDDYGALYRVEFDNGDEPIVAVKVKDASSDREYFLYVPPHVQSAHEGVAWTFGYDNVGDYKPDKET